MQTDQILIIVLIALVIAAVILIWLVMARRRSTALRDRFGDEYDRTLDDRGGRRAAEADLADRARRVDALDIRPLNPSERRQFTEEWEEVKSIFVDSPPEAVLHADRMLAGMMKTRGFPMGDFDRRYEDLTVDHSEVARHYRAGHDIAVRQEAGDADTEDLRQAMKHYEALFDEMVEDVSDTAQNRPVTAAAERA